MFAKYEILSIFQVDKLNLIWHAFYSSLLCCMYIHTSNMIEERRNKEELIAHNLTLTYDTMTWISFRRWSFKGSEPTTWFDVSRAHEN